jgi:hypothetical protein
LECPVYRVARRACFHSFSPSLKDVLSESKKNSPSNLFTFLTRTQLTAKLWYRYQRREMLLLVAKRR